jgi:hypothetical protein
MSRIGAETKPPWRSVPGEVRRAVEEVVGGRVRRAARVWGGYAPSPTFRLILDGGARLVFKGVSPASNPHMLRALEDEERVYRELAGWIHPWAPAFHGSFHAAGWHVLLLEDVGRASVPPWTRSAIHAWATAYPGSAAGPVYPAPPVENQPGLVRATPGAVDARLAQRSIRVASRSLTAEG